jgi:hypothetical protein
LGGMRAPVAGGDERQRYEHQKCEQARGTHFLIIRAEGQLA